MFNTQIRKRKMLKNMGVVVNAFKITIYNFYNEFHRKDTEDYYQNDDDEAFLSS